MKRKIISILLVAIMLITIFMPSATAILELGDKVLVETISVEPTNDPRVAYWIMQYKKDGKTYPVFCLEHGKDLPHGGVDATASTENVLTEEQQTMIWRILKSTYPNKTLAEIGAQTEAMAQIATARAIWKVTDDISLIPGEYTQEVQDTFTPTDLIIFGVARTIYGFAQVSTEEFPDPQIEIKKVPTSSKAAIDVNMPSYISQTYEVDSNYVMDDNYTVSLKNAPSGAFVGTTTGTPKTIFAPGEQFKVFVPVVVATQAGSLTVEVSTEAKGYRFYRGLTSEDTTQDVLLPYEFEDIVKDSISLEYDRTEFDLALKKFIYTVNGINKGREILPKEDASGIVWEDETNISYNKQTDVVGVKRGDRVVYTIRIFNEGQIDGYATEIVDDVPEGLLFDENDALNIVNGWSLGADGRIYTSTLDCMLIPAYNPRGNNGHGQVHWADVEVAFTIAESVEKDRIIINTAEIYEDYNESDVPDTDSEPGNNVPGEDDIDIEKVKVLEFDLALKKFIAEVNDENKGRSILPAKDINNKPIILNNGQVKYNKKTDVVEVEVGDRVVYTIRIFNEGNVDGYATEIVDDVPEGLLFAEDDLLNTTNGWTLGQDGRIYTRLLADELIKAYNPETGVLSYVDVQVAFTVGKAATGKIVINTAEIHEDDNEYDIPDEDSEPGNNVPDEDDIDIEKIKVPEPENLVFDLSLKKFIKTVNGNTQGREIIPAKDINNKLIMENGQIKYNKQTDVVGVKKGDKVVYTIRIFNEGNVDGYATEIVDDVPNGLIFDENDALNIANGWSLGEDGRIYTGYLADTLIPAYDLEKGILSYADVQVAFTVGSVEKDRIVINTAEIYEDDNEYDIPDEDSIPGNDRIGEDDIDVEKIRVQKLELEITKYVEKVIVNRGGKEEVFVPEYVGGEIPPPPKVEVSEDEIDDIDITIIYNIAVKNIGEIPGYATEIVDNIPPQLKFLENDAKNVDNNWVIQDDKLVTTKLADTLLQPGDTAITQITLGWDEAKDNIGHISNTADITKAKNEYDDEYVYHPGKPADFIVSVKTGNIPMNYVLIFGTIMLLTVAVVAIRLNATKKSRLI